jgi:hypothetical protein
VTCTFQKRQKKNHPPQTNNINNTRLHLHLRKPPLPPKTEAAKAKGHRVTHAPNHKPQNYKPQTKHTKNGMTRVNSQKEKKSQKNKFSQLTHKKKIVRGKERVRAGSFAEHTRHVTHKKKRKKKETLHTQTAESSKMSDLTKPATEVPPQAPPTTTTAAAAVEEGGEPTAVFVTNISPSAGDKTVSDFFSFCGEIRSLVLRHAAGHADGTQEAIVTFESAAAAKTAQLLTNALIVDRAISVRIYNPEKGKSS